MTFGTGGGTGVLEAPTTERPAKPGALREQVDVLKRQARERGVSEADIAATEQGTCTDQLRVQIGLLEALVAA